MLDTASAALEYCSRGWSVFPVRVEGKTKKPCVEWKDARADANQVQQWWQKYPDADIGVALGKASNLVRVDADSQQGVDKFLEFCDAPPDTMEFTTPSGGHGWLFVYDGSASDLLWHGDGEHEELRFLSDGRYTVVPPSNGYSWVNQVQLAKLPRKFAGELLSRRAARALRAVSIPYTVAEPDQDTVLEALRALHPARADDRESWLQVGMALHSAGDYLDAWVSWSQTSDKFKQGECEELWCKFSDGGITVRTLLFLAKQDGWRSSKLYEPLTDVGNGRVLARACKGKAVHCRAWKKWLAWDGKRWFPDAEFEVVAEAKRVIRDRYEQACKSLTRLKDLADQDAKAAKLKSVMTVVKWCTTSEAASKIHAAVDMSRSEPGILIEHTALDQHPWLLCCANGVLDLRSFALSPHDPSLRVTQLCPTEYWPEALCPRWDKFLMEVFVDAELVTWVQKLLGYCLTGVVSEHVLPVFYGTGRNGKSTLIKTVIGVLGSDYSGTTPSGFLNATNFEQHPTKLAELYGKRFVADLETSDGMKLNEELVKRVTGGDELKARRMREDFWHFQPTHKLVLATNYEPKVRGTDAAIWARIKKVPFSVSFAGREDRQLDAALTAEAPGILRWLVEGCKKWQREGLADVAAVKLATAEYKEEQDTVGQWFADRVERSEGSKVRKSDAGASYKQWCSANSVEACSPKAFGASMASLNVASDESGKCYVGIKLI